MSLSEYSCKIYGSEVKDTDPVVLCDLRGKWIHSDCASIGETQYEKFLKKVLYHGTVPIVSWNFSSLQLKTMTFKNFSVNLITIILTKFLEK